MEIADDSPSLQALYLPFVQKNGTESRHRRQEKETNLDVFTKVSEPSFQVVWLCNVVLIDIQRFSRCLCNTPTKYR